MLQIIWQGTDITKSVSVTGCEVKDTCGARCDSLTLEMDHAATWYAWGPETDDEIEVSEGGYGTGKLYLSAVAPEGDGFRVIATSLPARARQRAWDSFTDATLEDVFRRAAAEVNMGYALFGVDRSARLPYWERGMESPAAMLSRLMDLEGAVLKCVNGKLTGIGIEYAAALPPACRIEVKADTDGASYERRDGDRLRALTVLTPFARVTAEDTGALLQRRETRTDVPARDAVTAGRWARGLLRALNRKSETLSVESDLNPAMTAMARVDVTGNTDASGVWLVEEAEHDLVNLSTRARLFRPIGTIR